VHSSLVNMFKNGARALRTYLEVSFSEKDEAKEVRGRGEHNHKRELEHTILTNRLSQRPDHS
jgi:hypothetical protein